MKNRVVYYKDELNAEIVNFKRDKVTVSEDFVYINKNPLWLMCSFFIWRICMVIFCTIYTKLILRVKIVNKKVFKGYKSRNKGYFLFGNHTNTFLDGLMPNMYNYPKKSYFVASPDNIALKGTKNLMLMMGVMPIATDIKGMKKFNNAVEKRAIKNCVTIYPEAHIWPYYTKIRNFPTTSFRYPIKSNDATFCATTTYQKKKFSLSKKPRVVIYLDGPFFPDKELNLKEQQKQLRDIVYNKMVERSKNNNVEYIKYIKEE